jgi:hypothetical protein
MHISKHLFWLFMILSAAFFNARAQDDMAPQPLPKYRMELVYIFGTEAPEFIFVINNVGFKSVESLKKFLSNLPAGSTLEWAPGCKRIGIEPLLSSDQDMKDFREFCAERRLNFILVPSG